MNTHRHEIHRKGRELPGEFGTLFDWAKPEEVAEVVTGTDPVDMLRGACLEHLEREGVIVRNFAGSNLTKIKRPCYGRRVPAGPLRATYEADKHADPLGCLLNGTPYGAGTLPDAVRLLGVDEYWLVGFLHGFDNTPPEMIGRKRETFDRSPSYAAGRKAGRELAKGFKVSDKGWECDESEAR